MRRSYQRTKFVDLTSLLDVVLILLFALMMVLSGENEAAKDDVEKVQQQNEAYRQEVLELQEEKTQLQNQQDTYEALLSQYPLESEDTALTLTQMQFMAEGYVLINLAVDSEDNDRLTINEDGTNILIDTSLRGNQQYAQTLKARIQDALFEKVQGEGPGKNVLVTLIQDASMTIFAYDLIEEAVADLELDQDDVSVQLMIYQNF